jgi:regulator of sirC expression with transglutaminase-like and TPR domain
MASEAIQRMVALVDGPPERFDLAAAALCIAAAEHPDLDSARCLAKLDELAAGARGRVGADVPAAERVGALNHFLFVEQGFQGDDVDYYDPRNSFLNEVLDRRRGIPITLAIVYGEVARRIGLEVAGVGFPGHFLVRHLDPEILIDPFHGTVITREECAERLRAVAGPDARFHEELFRPATPRQILVRMLRNLKQIYLRRGDFARSLGATDGILLLEPGEPGELRDRGALYRKLECFAAALADFETFLELAPSGPGADEVRASLPELRRRASLLQ